MSRATRQAGLIAPSPEAVAEARDREPLAACRDEEGPVRSRQGGKSLGKVGEDRHVDRPRLAMLVPGLDVAQAPIAKVPRAQPRRVLAPASGGEESGRRGAASSSLFRTGTRASRDRSRPPRDRTNPRELPDQSQREHS